MSLEIYAHIYTEFVKEELIIKDMLCLDWCRKDVGGKGCELY